MCQSAGHSPKQKTRNRCISEGFRWTNPAPKRLNLTVRMALYGLRITQRWVIIKESRTADEAPRETKEKPRLRTGAQVEGWQSALLRRSQKPVTPAVRGLESRTLRLLIYNQAAAAVKENIMTTKTLSLYAISRGYIYNLSPAEPPCIACYQAGCETTGNVWGHGDSRFSVEEGRWESCAPNDLCEVCLLDEGVFALAEDVFAARTLAERYDAGDIQPDNGVFEGVQTVYLRGGEPDIAAVEWYDGLTEAERREYRDHTVGFTVATLAEFDRIDQGLKALCLS